MTPENVELRSCILTTLESLPIGVLQESSLALIQDIMQSFAPEGYELVSLQEDPTKNQTELIEAENGYGKCLAVRGVLQKEGTEAGYLERLIYFEDRLIINEYLHIYCPGQGLAPQILSKSLAFLERAGIEFMHIHAELTHGPIYWAKAHYDFDQECNIWLALGHDESCCHTKDKVNKHFEAVLELLGYQITKSLNLSPNELVTIGQRHDQDHKISLETMMDKLDDFDARANNELIKERAKAFGIADLTDKLPLGEAVLMCLPAGGWYGILNLKNYHQRTLFQIWLHSKVKSLKGI